MFGNINVGGINRQGPYLWKKYEPEETQMRLLSEGKSTGFPLCSISAQLARLYVVDDYEIDVESGKFVLSNYETVDVYYGSEYTAESNRMLSLRGKYFAQATRTTVIYQTTEMSYIKTDTNSRATYLMNYKTLIMGELVTQRPFIGYVSAPEPDAYPHEATSGGYYYEKVDIGNMHIYNSGKITLNADKTVESDTLTTVLNIEHGLGVTPDMISVSFSVNDATKIFGRDHVNIFLNIVKSSGAAWVSYLSIEESNSMYIRSYKSYFQVDVDETEIRLHAKNDGTRDAMLLAGEYIWQAMTISKKEGTLHG